MKEINDNADDVNFANYCLTKLKSETTRSVSLPLENDAAEKVAAAGANIAPGPSATTAVASTNISCGKLVGDALCDCRGVAGSQFWLSSGNAKKDALEKQLASNQAKETENKSQHNDLVRGNQSFLAFIELEKSGRWYINLISTTPYDLLILSLVMFMGALGGMVRLLRDYGDVSRIDPEPKDYFFIPLIGMVVAIGGYVMAKADSFSCHRQRMKLRSAHL